MGLPIFDINFILQLGQIIGAITAVSVFVWYVGKFLVKLYKQIIKSFEGIDLIQNELTPNSKEPNMRSRVESIDAHMLSIQEDITHVKLDTARLRARFAAIITSFNAAMWETDSSGKLIKANATFLNMVGRQLEEVIGNGWENFVHPGDRERVWEEWSAAVSRQRAFESSYRIVNSQTNRIIVVRAMAAPFFENDNEDQLVGYVGSYTKISEAA